LPICYNNLYNHFPAYAKTTEDKQMKKSKKRLLSTLLVMAMTFTLLPFGPTVLVAGAAENLENPPKIGGGGGGTRAFGIVHAHT
jgi:hypothetical protein